MSVSLTSARSESEAPHRVHQDGRAGHDHVASSRGHHGDRGPLRVGHRGQLPQGPLGVRGREGGSVDQVRVVALEPERAGLERGGRARHRHERAGVPSGHRSLDLVEVGLDHRSERPEIVFRRWVGGPDPLGEPDAPHLRGDRVVHDRRRPTEHEFRGPTADVDQEERSVGGIESSRPSEEGERGLSLPVDHLRLDADQRSERLEELLLVGGITNGARGSQTDALRAQRASSTDEPGDGTQRPFDRVGSEPAGAIHILAKTSDAHVSRDLHRILARTPGFEHQEPGRVRALIDRRHPAGRLGAVDRLHPLGGPSPHRIVSAREVIRVMGVQALDASTRASDPAPLFRALHHLPALGRVGAMGLVETALIAGSSPRRAIHPSDSSRETAFTAAGHVSQ